MRRRDFVTLLGGAAVGWPRVARAQQVMPVIGFLNPTSPDVYADRLRAFRQGLKEIGYAEGENVAIAYRWAEGQYHRLPEMAAELVARKVAVIVAAGGNPSAFAGKAATTTIPIVFTVAEDPVKLGLVASLARPGGNATGINILSGEVVAKRLELLRELVPAATRVAVLINPTFPGSNNTVAEGEAAARAMGLQMRVVRASSSREISAAFATFERERPDALFVESDPFFTARRIQLSLLAARHAIPAAYGPRELAEVGGLMSYGTSLAEVWRQIGVYAGRILKGAKPADLPVVQVSRFELVINAETARLLGLAVPPMLLARADEVIE